MLNTDLQIKRWKPAKSGERETCGQSLYIRGWSDGTKAFEFRVSGSWVTLGRYPALSFAEARAMIPVCKSLIKDGVATTETLKSLVTRTQKAHELQELANRAVNAPTSVKGMKTFDDAFYDWFNRQKTAGKFTHAASERRPRSQYENHARKHIGNLRLDEIRRPTIKNFMQPIFETMPETATSLLEYIRRVLEEAVDDEIIETNPCPKKTSFTVAERDSKPHASLHHNRLNDLWNWIKNEPNISQPVKTAMRLAVISIHRASVVALMRKEHYDPETGYWIIPPKARGDMATGMMKSKRGFSFVVPTGLRKELRQHYFSNNDCEFMFSIRGAKPIHPETLRKQFKRFDIVTTHGFRNTFKVWCLENGIDNFLADRYADHGTSGLRGLDRSYRRTDLFEMRIALGEQYLNYVSGVEK